MAFFGNRPNRPSPAPAPASTICPHCHKDTTKPPSITTKAAGPIDVASMIDEIEAVEGKLTPWEREFIDSVSGYIGSGRKPSEKQIAIIQRIHDEKT